MLRRGAPRFLTRDGSASPHWSCRCLKWPQRKMFSRTFLQDEKSPTLRAPARRRSATGSPLVDFRLVPLGFHSPQDFVSSLLAVPGRRGDTALTQLVFCDFAVLGGGQRLNEFDEPRHREIRHERLAEIEQR